MFISKTVIDWFASLKTAAETQAAISAIALDAITKENAALRAETSVLKEQNITLRVMGDWMRSKINQLEAERAVLLEKAYGVRIPVPEIARLEQRLKDGFDLQALFNDPEEVPTQSN